MKMKKILCSFILALVIALTLAPVSVTADETGRTEDESEGILQKGGLLLEKEQKRHSAEPSYATLFAVIHDAALAWDGSDDEMEFDVSDAALPYSDDYRSISASFLNSNPDMFFVDHVTVDPGEGETVKTVSISFNTQYSDSDAEAFEVKVAEILSGIDEAWSDEQKALYIHDYLVTHCEYDLTYSNYDAYSAIVTGRAVCQGYALAYRYLMDQIGVTCDIISSREANHAWNLITIGSEPYYVDCTWDDPIASSSTFYQDYCRHTNFLRSKDGLVDIGHTSTDWVDSMGNKVYSGVVTGDAYEEAWWNDCITAIPHIGDQWAYTGAQDPTIYLHDYSDGSDHELLTLNARWYVWDKPGYFWETYYTHLAAHGGFFYASSANTIYRFTPDGDLEEMYWLSDEELAQGYIYGIRTEGNRLYYRLYTGYDAGTFAGENYLLLANEPAVIISQPEDQEVIRGETAVFTVEVEGPVAAYQWEYKIKGKTKWYSCSESMEGYDTAELHVTGTTSRDGFQYRCAITSESGEVTISSEALLTVIEPVVPTGDLFTIIHDMALKWDGDSKQMEVDVSERVFPYYDEYETISPVFLEENPDLYFVKQIQIRQNNDGTVKMVNIYFDMQFSRAYQKKVKKILSGIDANWSDEQKALYIHDYLVTHCEYDFSYSNEDAFSALVTGYAVAKGYASAYNYLMNQCGIECDIVTSRAIDHVWNLIKINGEPYYVDCTWDDPIASNSTFYQDYCRHTNFLRSKDGMVNTGHTSTDWMDSSGNNVYSAETGTVYEDAWWSSCRTAIPYIGSKWAYIPGEDGCVYVYDYSTGANAALFSLNGHWPVWGGSGSYYNGFEHLAAAKEYFYASTADTIYRFTPDSGPEAVYSLTDDERSRGYIYGIRTEGNKLYYRLYTSYDAKTFAGEGSIVLFNESVVIISQPEDQEVMRDETTVFAVEAEGPVAAYQWEYKIKGKTKWYCCSASMEGYDTAELHVAATLSRNGFQYRCVITDADGATLTSNPAVLTVIPEAAITMQPKSCDAGENETAYFTVEAEGKELTYQWQYKIAGTGKWRNCSSSTAGYQSEELQVTATLARNGYQYRCIVTDAAGNTATSQPATLSVTKRFGITAQPQDVTAEENSTAQFTVEAIGENLAYQWQYKIAGTSKWRNSSSSMTGYNGVELHVTATAVRNGYQYRCIVTDDSGNTEISSAATLTVTSPGPKINADPQNQTVAAGETAHFTVAASGDGLTYQWQYKAAGSRTWRNSSPSTTGYNSAELEVVGTTARNGFQYRCKVTDENGETVTSKPATLTVE